MLGAAWMAGALSAVQVQLTRPVGDAEVLVGTSVGSIVAAVLRSGFCTDDLVAHQRGSNDSVLSALCAPDLGCASGPPWPLSPVGSPRLLWKALLAPRTVHPWVIAAACLPRGRADHRELRSMVDGLPRTHQSAGQTWLTAVDYGSGRRVVFGRAGDPAASLADAVVASCSVPGWYRPTEIGGRRYIDGGVRSGTNADLLTHAGLDRVYVLAPMASLVSSPPRGRGERLDRFIRRKMTNALHREVAQLRDNGSEVIVLTPGPMDLAAIGGNMMDSRRRVEVFETSLVTCAAALAVELSRLRGAA